MARLSRTPALSIVVPCRNEAKRLAAARGAITAFLAALEERTGLGVELVLEEDGSADGTPRLLDEFARADRRVKAVHCSVRLGKGGGIALGVQKSRGKFIVMCDADFPVPAPDVARMVSLLEENDLVVPSRRLGGSRTKNIPFLRKIFSRAFNLYVNALLNLGVSDTQIGVKAFRTSAFDEIRPVKFTSYSMDVEMLVRARRAGMRIAELPVSYTHSGGAGFNWLSDGPKMLLDVVKLRSPL